MFKRTTLEPLSGLVIMISLFVRKLLIARKHSLCIVKSREFIVLSQYKRARSASRAFNIRRTGRVNRRSSVIRMEIAVLTQACLRFCFVCFKEEIIIV